MKYNNLKWKWDSGSISIYHEYEDKSFKKIARTDSYSNREVAESKANLFCAAPDLLEALEELKCELILSDVDMSYIDSHFGKALEKAKKAIAKANNEIYDK